MVALNVIASPRKSIPEIELSYELYVTDPDADRSSKEKKYKKIFQK